MEVAESNTQVIYKTTYMKSHTVQFMIMFWMPSVHSRENTGLPVHSILYKIKIEVNWSTKYKKDIPYANESVGKYTRV